MGAGEPLTPYDEFPVHQSSRPFSHVPSTDFSWDDGYFFGAYSADEGVFLFTGLRVSPNSDVVGAYAGINVRGRQYTVRVSRRWRPDFSTSVGPLSVEFVRPMEQIRLTFAENDSALQFELEWDALAPPYLESHHHATSHGRQTTDQSRYVQCGAPRGWISFEGERYAVGEGWYGSRDHSWGLYDGRKPLGDPSDWLPPADPDPNPRALRFWMPFQTPDHVGFYHFHEASDGSRLGLNDVFGTPFEGWIDRRGDRVELVDVSHDLRFLPDTRALSTGRLEVVDRDGGRWVQEVELASPPWFPLTIGYLPGSWSDGGTIATYHASEGDVCLEWDDFDHAAQPFTHRFHGGFEVPGMHGAEHLVRVTSTAPDGTTSIGLAQIELFIQGAYAPYGFS
jgi:hypothetical protein